MQEQDIIERLRAATPTGGHGRGGGMTEQTAILPSCPLCRGTTLSVEPLSSAWGTGEELDHVVCDTCGAGAPVDAWANRAPVALVDTDLSFDHIVRLKAALTWLGHSTPESMEECAAKQKSLVLDLIRSVEGLKKEMNSPARLMQFDPVELDTIRQWFDSVHDVTPAYLDQRDYELAKRIYGRLGWRVPESISWGCNAVLPASR